MASELQKAVRRTLPLFGLIALSFFLPTVRACDTWDSPLTLTIGSPTSLGLMIPYLAALFFLILSIRLLCSSPPGRRWDVSAVVSLILCAASALLCVIFLLAPEVEGPLRKGGVLAAGIALILAGTFFLLRARQQAGPALWHDRCAAYAFWASPLGLFFLILIFSPEGSLKVGPGGYLYTLSVAVLAVTSCLGGRSKGG